MSVRSTQEILEVSVPSSSKVRSTQEILEISVSVPAISSKVRSTQEVLLISVPFIPLGIVYPLSPPAIAGIGPQDFSLTEVNVVGETESPFTLGQQEQQWPGQAWELEVNLPPMLYVQAEQWISFLGALFGKYGTFLMGDYNRLTPQGPMSGSPVAAGSNASGLNSINLRGATFSIGNWAVAGDYIQLQVPSFPQRLYKVLQNASSDGGGNVAGLTIFPNLHETVPDGTVIVTSNCRGTFRLQENKQPWKVDKNKVYTISFKAKEAI
jgi:hypothetical protein